MFGPEVDEAARAHAMRAAPCESCGVVVAGKYVACDNTAQNPREGFRLPAKAYTKYGEVDAIIHSHVHPRHGAGPSEKDMISQQKEIVTIRDGQMIEKIVPWGIILANGSSARGPEWLCDESLNVPLIGRRFLHAIRDCYSLIRAYYWQQTEHPGPLRELLGIDYQVKLPDFPRDDEWWKDKPGRPAIDLIGNSFQRAGFVSVDKREARNGDILVFRIRSKYPNHCAVYLGKGLIVHHLGGDPNSLSTQEALGTHGSYVTEVYRFAPDNSPSRRAG